MLKKTQAPLLHAPASAPTTHTSPVYSYGLAPGTHHCIRALGTALSTPHNALLLPRAHSKCLVRASPCCASLIALG